MSFDLDGDDGADEFLDATRITKSGSSTLASIILGAGSDRTDNVPIDDTEDEDHEDSEDHEDAPAPGDTKHDPEDPLAAEKRQLREGKYAGIDLNDESAVVQESEDRKLSSHMKNARARLADIERKAGELLEDKKLKEMHVTNLRELSSSFTEFRKRLGEYQTATEVTHVHSRNATKLANGEKPHGYPEVKAVKPENAGPLAHMAKKISENGEEHQKLHDAFVDILNRLGVLRRNYESVVDGYAKRAQHHHEMYAAAADGLVEDTTVVAEVAAAPTTPAAS